MNASKKFGKMTEEERGAFLEGTPKITEEEAAEYGIYDVESTEGYCDDPEVMKNTMRCLGDKFLTEYTIVKARMQSKGEWMDECDTADDGCAKDDAIESMSIFEYEDRYGEKNA